MLRGLEFRLGGIFNGLLRQAHIIPHNNRHFIMVGRTSKAIAQGIVNEFGHGGRTDDGPLIDRPGPVIQGRFSTFDDGESSAELFVDDTVLDHPIHQTLSPEEKELIVSQMRGADMTIVHSISGKNTSSRAMSLLHMATHLKEEIGVANIHYIAPHLPYMRNDRQFTQLWDRIGKIVTLKQYNAVSSGIYAKQLKDAYIKDVTGFEAHSRDGVENYRRRFGKNHANFINMGNFFARALAREFDLVSNGECQVIVLSPDGMDKPNDYGIARAQNLADTLYANTEFASYANAPHFLDKPYMAGIAKKRFGPRETRITDFKGNVYGKICIVVDDIINTGGTTIQAAEKLKEQGAYMVIAVATHAVLPDGALAKLLNSRAIDRIMLTDTIPRVIDKMNEFTAEDESKLVIETISPLVNDEIARYVPRFQPGFDNQPTLRGG